MQESIIGQTKVVERILLALLCNGNVLVEGLPGLAKTRTIKALAQNLDAKLSRIQFTPDLLPSDVTGSEVLHTTSDGTQQLSFEPGPIFANLVLADEINRSPAKVQAALLEAMEERQVTVSGKTHKMEPLFMVMATQNPIEQEGTYPLPEAQMDRFLMKVLIEHPPKEDEVKIMRLVRGETSHGGTTDREPISQQVVFDARKEIDAIHISESVENYIADLIEATRNPGTLSEDLKNWIQIGASPRGTIALDKASRANAWMNARDFTTPDDVSAVAHEVLRHRVQLTYDANADGVSTDDAITELLGVVAVG